MNIWRFHWFLLKFLWEVTDRDGKKCSPGNDCFNTSMINPVFQNKSWVTWKKLILLHFLGGSIEAISTTRATLNTFQITLKLVPTHFFLENLFEVFHDVNEFQEKYTFFITTLIFNSAPVLLNFLMNWASNVP